MSRIAGRERGADGTPPESTPPPLAHGVAARFAALPEVAAVALAGSCTGLAADGSSDIDLYVYADAELPIAARAAIAGDPLRREFDLRVWEPGDLWVDAATGTAVDVMYRSPAWIETEIDRVLVHHQAAVGSTTCLWHNVRTSAPLYDRDGWFARLQRRADQPYPEPLRRAIVAKNHPILCDSMASFLDQIEAALRRRDLLSVQHRLTALLGSYFDVLFALNRQTHPGEKRLVDWATARCPLRPSDLAGRIDGLLRAAPPPWDGREERLPRRIHGLIDPLDDLLRTAGLVASKGPVGPAPASR